MGEVSRLRGKRVYLDANVFIYLLENIDPWGSTCRKIIAEVDRGRLRAFTSELSLAECLVKPFQTGRTDIFQAYIDTIRSRPSFTVAHVNREVLIQAAKLRSSLDIKLPDAIHVSTALANECDYFLSNDLRLKRISQPAVLALGEL